VQVRRISRAAADEILRLFADVPDIQRDGIGHIEVLQLYVEQISKDRISDFACSFLKSFLVDYTIDQTKTLGIPTTEVDMNIYRLGRARIEAEVVSVPVNPTDGLPILLVPKRWLRKVPWISYDDYFERVAVPDDHVPKERVAVLNFNRSNYGVVSNYVKERERVQEDCHNDPLFTQIPVRSAKRKLTIVQKLPTGKEGKADRLYEDAVGQLLASLFYPELDFAAVQSRTESGVLIRDIVFYNNLSVEFLRDIHTLYGSRQIVFELKNVRELERDHVNQLNRYLNEQFGSFGVFVTRNPAPTRIRRSLVDLWSAQRKAIVVLTDSDLEQMVAVFESKQRKPLEVLKRSYVEFTRSLPG
jgi:hypothetical protein